MTILLFGRTGQVAREIQALAPVIALGRDAADLAVPGDCAAAIERYAPSAVINAAAYTFVDRAEEEEDLASQINGWAAAEMARACAMRQIAFVHLSTDYVFDGSGTKPWSPGDRAQPLSAYGRSKLAGERGIAEAGGCYVILRTSWVFSEHGQNFVKTMLRLGQERSQVGVVSDQIGGPTSAVSIARACLAIADQLTKEAGKTGTYHFAGTPAVSWADFARTIFAQAGMNGAIADIRAADYPQRAQRPANSRLDCSSTAAAFGLAMPDWRSDLDVVVGKLKERMGR